MQGNQGSFNGGILNPMREHLKLGNYYYRFVSNRIDHSRKIGGAWWIDADTLNGIYNRFHVTGPNPRVPHAAAPASSTFREWLALTFEWNMIEEIVIAALRARMDCYSGFGRQAQGRDPSDTRAFGYASHLSNLFTIKQLCIPEVYVHQAQAFPHCRIVPFDRIDDVVSGRLI